jgi:maltose alpha-D-glucosyltransferase/alpha-amylase
MFLPPITDPEYHYEAVNVEAQQANPQSLLWWMKRLIALRKEHVAFGRGSLTFLHPDNRRIVAFVREHGNERILVVANMSRFVQYANLDLSAYRGLVPVEMFGRVEFPRVEDGPLFLTLGPHAFIWFTLEADPSGRGADVPAADEPPPTISAPADLDGLLAGRARAQLLSALPAYIRARRWFRSKARRIKRVTLRDSIPVDEARIAIFDVEYNEGEAEAYVLPLALGRGEDVERIVNQTPQALVAYVAPAGSADEPPWLLYDAIYDARFSTELLDAIAGRRRFNGRRGQVTASPTAAFRRIRGSKRDRLEATVGRAEQSNTSVLFGDRLMLKLFRRIEPGVNPDIEVGGALTDARFEHTPAVGGWLAYRTRSEEPAALGLLQAYVPNEGDVWEYTLDQVSDFYERVATETDAPPVSGSSLGDVLAASREERSEDALEKVGSYLGVAHLLGERTAQLHRALAAVDDGAFAPEPFTALYQRSLFQTMRNQVSGTFATLRQKIDSLPDEAHAQARAALELADEAMAEVRELVSSKPTAVRIRTHGDYHAGQVLWTGKDVVMIDFEGEPGRPLSERRFKRSALTDVAGMLRSFHYAAYGTLLNPRLGGAVRPEDVHSLERWAPFWYVNVAATFLSAYLAEAGGQPFVPADDEELRGTLELLMLQKVLYELSYELNNRPDWVSIPLRGLLDLYGRSVIPNEADQASAPTS